jgi:serine/threonine protein kinase
LSVLIHEANLASSRSNLNQETPAATPRAGEEADTFAPGALVGGKLRVERKLAEGGIGVIVLATHVALNQRVAIKYLKARALKDPKIVERFEREARLAVQITSEHVVRVHDVGRDPTAGPYMVMEYLVGQDLWRVLEKGPLAIPRAVDYLLQACDALAEAHALRIVHRDIKPENMFLAERPSNTPIVKIIDFGISKVAPKRGDDGKWARQTQASERFGTPVYMSPEQLRASASVDARTDIWSLGVSLFELLTTELPFGGGDVPQLCTSILTAPARRLRELRAGAPEELELVIVKCLEKDAALRYRNVAELAQALAPFATPEAARQIDRILRITRKAGDSIRPPTPMPGSLVLPLVPMLSAPSTITATVQSVADDLGPTGATPTPGGRRAWRIGLMAAAVGAAVVTAMMGTLAWRDGKSPQTMPPPPVLAAAPAPTEVQSATHGTPTTSPTVPPSAVASTATSAALAPSSVVKAIPRSASAQRPSAPSSTQAATTPAPTVVSTPSRPAADPRAQFGERQ